MTLSLGGELPSLGLHKPRGVALRGDLSNDRAIDRGVRRLAAGRLPVALGLGRLDHLLGGHRFARFLQDLGGGIQTTYTFLTKIEGETR